MFKQEEVDSAVQRYYRTPVIHTIHIPSIAKILWQKHDWKTRMGRTQQVKRG